MDKKTVIYITVNGCVLSKKLYDESYKDNEMTFDPYKI